MQEQQSNDKFIFSKQKSQKKTIVCKEDNETNERPREVQQIQDKLCNLEIINSQQFRNQSETIAQFTPPIHSPLKWAIYIISIPGVIDSILNKSITKIISHKDQITTIIYKCKLELLSAYNYTYAVYLTNLLNINFSWATVQILPIPQLSQQRLVQSDQYHVVYRFDVYDPNQELSNKSIRTISGVSVGKWANPFQCLLNKHYKSIEFDKLLTIYQQNRHYLSDYLTNLKTEDQSISQLKIKISDGKFEFHVDLQNFQDQQVIHLFETNFTFNNLLKNYHLYHDFKQCGYKFLDSMKKVFSKYPYFAFDN